MKALGSLMASLFRARLHDSDGHGASRLTGNRVARRRIRNALLLATPLVAALIGVAMSTAGGIAHERALGTTEWGELIQWGVVAHPGFFRGLFVGGTIGGALATAVYWQVSKS